MDTSINMVLYDNIVSYCLYSFLFSTHSRAPQTRIDVMALYCLACTCEHNPASASGTGRRAPGGGIGGCRRRIRPLWLPQGLDGRSGPRRGRLAARPVFAVCQ